MARHSLRVPAQHKIRRQKLFRRLRKSKFNLNQFGGSFGGPIQKDKTFFFVNYEAKRQRHGIPFIGLVPNADAEMGITRSTGIVCSDFTQRSIWPVGNTIPIPASHSSAMVPATRSSVNGDGSQVCAALRWLAPLQRFRSPADPPATAWPILSAWPWSASTRPAAPLTTGHRHKLCQCSGSPLKRGQRYHPRWITTSPAKIPSSPASATIRRTLTSRAARPTWAEQNPFGSNQLISNHGRNVVISETHIFNSNNINQAYFGYNRIFNQSPHLGRFGGPICEAANLGIVGADLNSACPEAPPGLTQYTKDCLSCGLSSTSMSSLLVPR